MKPRRPVEIMDLVIPKLAPAVWLFNREHAELLQLESGVITRGIRPAAPSARLELSTYRTGKGVVDRQDVSRELVTFLNHVIHDVSILQSGRMCPAVETISKIVMAVTTTMDMVLRITTVGVAIRDIALVAMMMPLIWAQDTDEVQFSSLSIIINPHAI